MTYDSKANSCARARARTGGLAEKVETMDLVMVLTSLLLDSAESTFNISGGVRIGAIDVCSASRLE